MKSERDQTLIDTRGGRTELLGGWAYRICKEAQTGTSFRIEGGELSFARVV